MTLMASRYVNHRGLDADAPVGTFNVFPLTASAQSSSAGVDYQFAYPVGSVLHHEIQRAYLVPAVGARAAAPPPPAVDEIFSALVTVGAFGDAVGYDVGHGRAGSLNQPIGAMQPVDFPWAGSGASLDATLAYPDDAVEWVRFSRSGTGPTRLEFSQGSKWNAYDTNFDWSLGAGLEIQGDYGTRVHWFPHAAEIHAQDLIWDPVDAGHGWASGQERRVRVVRVREGARTLNIFGSGTVATDGIATVTVTFGFDEALPRGVDTPVTLFDVVFGDVLALAQVTIPKGQRRVTTSFARVVGDASALTTVFAGSPGFFHVPINIPLIREQPAADGEIEYWSGTLTSGDGSVGAYDVVGFEANRSSFAPLLGSLDPASFDCCRGREPSGTERRVWALANLIASGVDIVALGMEGLVENGAAAPAFRRAQLQLNDLNSDGSTAAASRYPLDRADTVSIRTGTALSWPWVRDGPFQRARTTVRLTGPDHPVATGVRVVSTPASGTAGDLRYAAGETIEIELAFDEPVVVAGALPLTLRLGADDAKAAYAYGAGTDTLGFAYVVRAADTDADGVGIAAFPDAESIVSIAYGREAAIDDLDLETFADHKVDGGRTRPADLTVSVRDGVVSEAAGEVLARVVLSHAADAAQTYDYAAAGGTAVAGTDFAATSGTVTVPPGVRVATVRIPLIDDALDEPDETLTLALSRGGAALAEGTFTVRDDDLPVVRLAAPSAVADGGHLFENEVAGGMDSNNWVLTRDTAVPVADLEPLTVNLRVSETGGGDFVAAATEQAATAAFAAAATTAAYTPVVADDADEGHGRVTVTLAPGPGYVLPDAVADRGGRAEVRDDDGRLVEFAFDRARLEVAEGQSARVRVHARTVEDGTFTESGDLARVFGGTAFTPVQVSTTAAGGATKGADFTHVGETWDFPFADFEPTPGGRGLASSRAVPPIQTAADSVVDPDEEFEIVLDQLPSDARVVKGTPEVVEVVIRELTEAPTAVPADWSLTPTGLTARATFRLLFLSSTKRDGSSTVIADYNAFVLGRAAAGHADIRAYSAGFRAVGCTADTDARDNTRTTGTGVPIYWLNGAKVADNYADFYDGSWDDEANDKNESGTDGPDTSQAINYPLTGCGHDGTEAFGGGNTSEALGASVNRLGRPNTTGEGSLSSGSSAPSSNARPMYGLSAVFQVAAVTDPRVLLDATLTVGTYDEGVVVHATTDHWGYIDAAATGFAAETAGTLAGAAFSHEGREYAVKRLAVKGTADAADSLVLDIEDGAGADLAPDARVGIEVRSESGATVMIPWDLWNVGGALQDRLRAAAKDAVGDWRQSAAGATLPVRILDLGVQDVMSGHLAVGAEQTADIGGRPQGYSAAYAGIGAVNVATDTNAIDIHLTGDGALRPVADFVFDGVDYSVDTLGIVSFRDGTQQSRYRRGPIVGTVPELAEGVGLRLAAPHYPPGHAKHDGLVRYFPFDAGLKHPTLESDYFWDWDYHSTPNLHANRNLPIYLTTLPGETRVWDEVWSATVTPGRAGGIVAYRRPGATIPGESGGAATGAGALSAGAGTIVLDGAGYMVDAVGFAPTPSAASATEFPDFWFHSSPALPADGDLAFLVERDDQTRYYRIADATPGDRGYVWPWYDRDDNGHGWTSGDEKTDSTLNDRSVRLLRPVFLALVRLAVSADGTSVTLTYDGALDETRAAAAADFEVRVDGAAVAVTGVAVAGATVTLELGTAVLRRQAVTVTYRGTALRGADGTPAGTFAGRAAETGAAPLGPTLANPHPRVLLDTALTVGTYRIESTSNPDAYGYDGFDSNPYKPIEAGALERTTFLHDAVEYTIQRLTVETTGDLNEFEKPSFLIKSSIAGQPRDLPATAPIGLEFGTPRGGVAIDRRRVADDGDLFADLLEDVWLTRIGGEPLGLRVLHLGTPDLWNANLGFGARASSGGRAYIGYGGPASGTLSSTTIALDGVDYAVDRLTVAIATDSARLQFSSTPDLPAGVAVAVPYAAGSDAGRGLALHHRIDPAYANAGDAAVDYEWDWLGDADSLEEATAAVYLTRVPGGTARAEGAGTVAAFEVTPGKHRGLLAYRRANATIAGLAQSLAGVGTLDPAAGAVTVDGTAYAVNAVGFANVGDEETEDVAHWPDFVLSTEPALPAGKGLGVAVARAEGTYAYWIDQADDAQSYGYTWDAPAAVLNEHGWDMTVDGTETGDYRTWPVHIVRVARRESAIVALSLSRDTLAEGDGAVEIDVTAELDGPPRAAPTAVAVTAGAPGDTAAAADYEAAPLTLTIPAGSLRATGALALTAVDDAETEDAEFFTVTGTTPDLAVAGATVTIPGNDYGVYLSGTLTAAAGPVASPGSAAGVRIPVRHPLRLLRGDRRGGVRRRRARLLGVPGRVAVLEQRDPTMGATEPRRQRLALSVGDARLPLDDFAEVNFVNATIWNEDKLAELGASVSLEAGETYRVRILGPWHPRVTDASATSNPLSSVATGAGTAKVYAVGDIVRFRVDYDEPVTVTGAPTFAFGVRHGTTTTPATAMYLPAESTPTGLAFGYTVAAAEPLSGAIVLLDDTSNASGAQSPLAGGVIEAVLARSTATASRFMPAEKALGDSTKDEGQLIQTTGSPTSTVAVGVAGGPGRVPEAAGTLAFPLRLSRAPAAAVTVQYALTGTATAGADYAGAATGTLTIAAGAIAARVSLTLTDDALDEPDETVVLTLSSPGAGLALETDAASAEAVIVDDDLPRVSIAAPALATSFPGNHLFEFEAEKALSGPFNTDRARALLTDAAWKLTRVGIATDALEVAVSASERGGDFVAAADETTHAVTFEAGMDTAYFKIVDDDETDEPHGEVTVALEDGVGYAVAGPRESTVAVRDDDGGLFRFTLDPLDRLVVEGSGVMYDAVVATIDEGLQAGTFTAVEDLRRAMRRRFGFYFGDWEAWQAVFRSDGVGEAELGPTNDYTHLSLITDVTGADWDFDPAPGGGFMKRTAIAPIPTHVNDDGVVGTADATETIADERFLAEMRADTPGVDDLGYRMVAGTRENIPGLPDLDGFRIIKGVVTIRETAGVRLEIDDAELAEGDGDAGEEQATITASVVPPAAAAFEVAVSASAEGEGARWEFVGANRALSFAANENFATGAVTVRALHNDVDDGDLAVTLTGTPGSGSTLTAVTATVTIADDDVPKVSILPPELARNTGHVFEQETEADSAGRWLLTRAGVRDEELIVTVRVSETGGMDTDFVAFADDIDQTLTFSVDASITTYTPVSLDTTSEAHGTVTVTLRDGTGYDIEGEPAAAANVRDDDGPLLAVTVDPAALTVREGQPAQFYAVGATATDGTFTAPGDLARVFGGTGVAVNAASADGTATQPGDYAALAAGASATLLFAGATPVGGGTGFALRAALPAVATVDDGTLDADETFTVTVSRPVDIAGRIVLGSPATATATLVEGPVVTLALDDADLAEGETATVTATANPVHAAAFTVTVATDPATSDRFEFVGADRTFAFAADSATGTGSVRIRAVDNDIDDGDVDATVTGTVSDAAVVAPAAVAFAVRDDDLPKVSIAAPAFARNTGHVFEAEVADVAAAGGPWVLTRAGLLDAALAVTVGVSESGGDFVAPATEAADQTVTFAATEDTASYTPATADTTDEAHGTVTVTLRAGTGYDIEGPPAAAAAVRDDDGTLLTATVDPAALSVPEGQSARFYVAGATATDGTFTVRGDLARVFGGTGATVNAASADGTATAGTDYTALAAGASATLLFAEATAAAGDNGFRLRAALPGIATADDGTGDPGETFTVTVSLPTQDADTRIALGTPTTGTATLVEGPSVTLILDDDDLAEGETATVTATVDPVHAAAFAVTVATDPATSDRFEFVGANRVLSFAADSATGTGLVRIEAVDNDIDDGDVDAMATGTVSDAAVTAPEPVAFAVRDDDLPKVSIAAPAVARNTGHVFEGETMAGTNTAGGRWWLTREGLLDADLAVTVRASEAGGMDTDFVSFEPGVDRTVTFSANIAMVSYSPVSLDTTDEAHGTVTVTLRAGTGYDIEGPPAAAAAVRDDDGTLLTATVDPAALSVPEGQSARFYAAGATATDGTFTVRGDLARVFGGTGATVNAASADGTATAGTDYTALAAGASATLTFADATAAGGGFRLRAALPEIATEDDGTGDANETFTVTVSLPTQDADTRIALGTPTTGTATLVEDPSVTLILDDDDLAEGETATVTATVDPVHAAPFAVTVGTDPATSERFEFVGANRVLSFAADSATGTGLVRIEAVDNDIDDGDVDAMATGTVSDAAVTAPEPVAFAVRDDDLPKVSIAAPAFARNTGHVFEAEVADVAAAGGPWVLTRAGLLDAALAVTVGVSESGGDFVAPATEAADRTVTFSANRDMVSYSPVSLDTTDEAHGTVTVTLKGRRGLRHRGPARGGGGRARRRRHAADGDRRPGGAVGARGAVRAVLRRGGDGDGRHVHGAGGPRPGVRRDGRDGERGERRRHGDGGDGLHGARRRRVRDADSSPMPPRPRAAASGCAPRCRRSPPRTTARAMRTRRSR